MRRTVFTCIWPGLARLWNRGEARGLAYAVCFTLLLNTALVSTFVWPDLTRAVVRDALWLAVAIVWIISAWSNWRILQPLMTGGAGASSREDLFIHAQAEYLNGHWVEAESLLAQLLQLEPAESDARLMLGTLFRHTRQLDAAREQLDLLGRHAGGEKWCFEAAIEQRRLSELARQLENGKNEPVDSGDEQLVVEGSGVSDAA